MNNKVAISACVSKRLHKATIYLLNLQAHKEILTYI